jgi:hypothetical protein
MIKNILNNINYTNENLFNSNLNNIEYNIDKLESSITEESGSSMTEDSGSSITEESGSSVTDISSINEQFAAIDEELASIEEEESNNVLDVYFHGIDEFIKNIPDNYKYKKTIETKCEIIKDKLFYAAPEFMGQVFYMMHTLQGYIDEKEPWYEDAWSYIENSKIEAKMIM